jgi:hypothetical protein
MLAKSSRKRLKVIAFEGDLQTRKKDYRWSNRGKRYIWKTYLNNGHVHP